MTDVCVLAPVGWLRQCDTPPPNLRGWPPCTPTGGGGGGGGNGECCPVPVAVGGCVRVNGELDPNAFATFLNGTLTWWTVNPAGRSVPITGTVSIVGCPTAAPTDGATAVVPPTQPCIARNGTVDPNITLAFIDTEPRYFHPVDGEIPAAEIEVLDVCDPRCQGCTCSTMPDSTCDSCTCDCGPSDLSNAARALGGLR